MDAGLKASSSAMRILPSWLREFVNVAADDRQLAEDLTSAGIAVESVQEENGATIYEMDLTTNRVDAMNHYGVAREASAIYDVELKKIEPKLPAETAGPSTPARECAPASGRDDKRVVTFPSSSKTREGCARYTARIVRDVKIGPSPEHIAKRLELLGSRSINNVADATNYALNELGHPTHAFDLDLLEGGTIIVRRAREGEVLKTLDGVDRKLTTDDLVIADAKKPVALAGVMGGFDSMITERTKNVLIESAWFDPATVRSMAKRHGMHTDASHRFERGADWGITPLACDRVAELILAQRRRRAARRTHRRGRPQAGARADRAAPLGGEAQSRHRYRAKMRSSASCDSLAAASKQTSARLAARDDSSKLVQRAGSHLASRCRARDRSAGRAGAHLRLQQISQHAAGVHRRVVELPDEPKNAKVRETMLALGYDEAISITFISEQDAKTF